MYNDEEKARKRNDNTYMISDSNHPHIVKLGTMARTKGDLFDTVPAAQKVGDGVFASL